MIESRSLVIQMTNTKSLTTIKTIIIFSTVVSNFQPCGLILTVDVHPYGLDGRRAKAILSLAVVATSLGPEDLCNVQRFIEHTGVLEAVRHTTGCLGPSDLGRAEGRN